MNNFIFDFRLLDDDDGNLFVLVCHRINIYRNEKFSSATTTKKILSISDHQKRLLTFHDLILLKENLSETTLHHFLDINENNVNLI